LLHDVGKLVLAEGLRAEYTAIIRDSRASGAPLSECERKVLGTTHAHVGAYLLGIWGLPEGIVQCVGSHHATPGGETTFGPVAAVAIANHLAGSTKGALPDAWETWLQNIGLGDWRARWAPALAA
jgi:HD-like signal output (HDOD) protein